MPYGIEGLAYIQEHTYAILFCEESCTCVMFEAVYGMNSAVACTEYTLVRGEVFYGF